MSVRSTQPVPQRPRLSPAQERAALASFEAALDLPAVERSAWLAREAAADPLVQARAQALLAADAADTTGVGGATRVGDDGAPWANVLPPPRVGPYRLDELIGSGGMGAVYRAYRDDGLFEQTVAIKFVRPLRGVVAVEPLVDAERRLLARMQHPAIARILDGGCTDNGLQFLVMEFVDGVALDTHADEQALGTRQRVALLREVCAAVAHAHQHGVLHCDIKPANILVTGAGPAEARAVLIDFGVARIQDVIDARLPEGYTRAYTSPQRLAGEPATISDDVYALGMVLVELLTGELPDPRMLQFTGRPLDPELAAVARCALAPAREDRYPSVKALDDDLRAWLELRPLAAMGGHWRYRLRKLSQRHPWRVAAAGGSLVGVLVALAVISLLYGRAEAARQDAEARFVQVRALANFMLFELDAQLESTPGTTQARRNLIGRGQHYLDALAATAGQDAGLQREVAVGLTRLGEVQGVPGRAHVGETQAAKANLERAENMLGELTRQHPERWEWQRDLARSRYLLALVYGGRDNDAARQLATAQLAERGLTEALAAARRGAASPAALAELEVLLTSARLTQADAHKARNDHAAAAELQAGEEARLLALAEPVRQAMEFDYQSGRPAMLLGDSLYYLDRKPEALAAYQRAVARFRAGLQRTPLHRRLLEGSLIGHWSLSGTLDELGRREEALAEIERALPAVAQLVALDPGNAESMRYRSLIDGQHAVVLGNLGRVDEAIALTEQGLALKERRLQASPDDAERHRDVAVPLRNLASFYRSKGDQAGACRVLQRAEAAWRQIDQRWGLSQLDRSTDLEPIVADRRALGCG